jgi:N-acetylmuramoyl-L-alanine amidase
MRKFQLFIVVVVLMALSGCVTTRPTPRFAKDHLDDICQQYDIHWTLDSVSQIITLSHGALEAKVLVESSTVIFGNEHIDLSRPVRRTKSAIIIPPDFKEKVIDRLLTELVATPTKILKFNKIVIDAGHGGEDPGAIGHSGLQEKTVNLDIAKRLKNLLESKGIIVTMTRDRDDFITLPGRTEIATRAKPDLFVSIHANSNPNSRSVQGMEIYALRELDAKEKKEDQRLKNQRTFFKSLSMNSSSDLDKIIQDMLYTYKRSESIEVASYILDRTTRKAGIHNNGVHTAGFFVLRNTLIPAILVEVGYLTNAKEEGLLKTSDYRQKIAEGLAESILSCAEN